MPPRLVGSPITTCSRTPITSTASTTTGAPSQQLVATRWRLTCRRPLFVRSEVDERKGEPICDLMPGAHVDIVEQVARPDGSVRALIVDPVWFGWLTLSTKDGVANVAPVAKATMEPATAAAPAEPAPEASDAPAHAAAVTPDVEALPSSTALVIADQATVEDAPVALDVTSGDDPEIERVLSATNEFETLDLAVAPVEDLAHVRKVFRHISLAVHPDKNPHPQATVAFRKVFGAFETLCDAGHQRRRLAELQERAARTVLSRELADIQAAVDGVGNGDEEDEDEDEALEDVEWWREASVEEMDLAAEEAEGADMDALIPSLFAPAAHRAGGGVDDVRWIGTRKAIGLQRTERAIFIDCREAADVDLGVVPGAYHVPMGSALKRGVVEVMGKALVDALLTTRKHALVVVYSSIATPFSRCRAFCRLLLSAGHQTLHPLRLRRLRGGLAGWRRRGGEIKPLQATRQTKR